MKDKFPVYKVTACRIGAPTKFYVGKSTEDSEKLTVILKYFQNHHVFRHPILWLV